MVAGLPFAVVVYYPETGVPSLERRGTIRGFVTLVPLLGHDSSLLALVGDEMRRLAGAELKGKMCIPKFMSTLPVLAVDIDEVLVRRAVLPRRCRGIESTLQQTPSDCYLTVSHCLPLVCVGRTGHVRRRHVHLHGAHPRHRVEGSRLLLVPFLRCVAVFRGGGNARAQSLLCCRCDPCAGMGTVCCGSPAAAIAGCRSTFLPCNVLSHSRTAGCSPSQLQRPHARSIHTFCFPGGVRGWADKCVALPSCGQALTVVHDFFESPEFVDGLNVVPGSVEGLRLLKERYVGILSDGQCRDQTTLSLLALLCCAARAGTRWWW